MSSRFRLHYVSASLLAVIFAAASGCVDPKKTFGEFEERVVDAAPVEACPVVDFFPLNGEFLLAIQTSLGMPLRLVVNTTTTATEAGGTVDLTFQPLIAENCVAGMGGQDAGETLPPLSDVTVNPDGTFELAQLAATTPGVANPITCGDILADIEFFGCIQSEDFICGTVGGMVMEPIPLPLDGSTFGAVKIDTGTRGDANLPAAVGACPE
jgi:hypothetical protein